MDQHNMLANNMLCEENGIVSLIPSHTAALLARWPTQRRSVVFPQEFLAPTRTQAANSARTPSRSDHTTGDTP